MKTRRTMTAADRLLWAYRLDTAALYVARALPLLFAFALGVLLCAFLVTMRLL
jgi:hypothetical protein